MPDYKRLVSYMYNYEDGVKRNNVGYARVEARNGQCKCTLHIAAPSMNDKQLKAYIFKRKNGLEGILLGVLQIKNGIGDYKIITDSAHIMNSPYSLEDMVGIVLYLSERKFFATEWDESPVTMNMVTEIERKAAEKLRKASLEAEKVKRTSQTAEAVKVIGTSRTAETEKVKNASQVAEAEQEKNLAQEAELDQEVKAANIAVLYLDSSTKKSEEKRDNLTKAEEVERIRKQVVFTGNKENLIAFQGDSIERATNKQNQESHIHPLDGKAPENYQLHKEINQTTISESETETDNGFCGYQDEKEFGNSQTENLSDRVTLIDNEEGIFPQESLYRVSPEYNEKISSEQFNTAAEYYETRTTEYNETIPAEYSGTTTGEYNENINIQGENSAYLNSLNNNSQNDNPKYKNSEYENSQYNNSGYENSDYPNTNNEKSDENAEKEVQSSECKKEEQGKFYDDHPVAKRIYRSFPRMYPFEDNEIAWCVKIEPQDIGMFPMETWILGNNSFLLHGFYSYRHLIFAKINDKNGFNYILGVPGIYHNREKFMAKMFGFENFKCVKRKLQRTGEFGYWYVPIRLN